MTWKRKEVIGNAELYLGDCLEILPSLPKVDAVITDPPYGVGINYGAYDDNPKTYWGWFKPRLQAIRSACPLVVFTHRVAALKELTDWDWCGVWNKPGAFGARIGNSCVLPHWEPILMYGIHGAGTKSEYTADVFTFNPEPAKANIKGIGREKWQKSDLISHPCPKPVPLYDQLMRAFGQHAEVVCDPFMGSATTAICAGHLGKRFVGIEIEKRWFDAACERIENAQRQARMFA
jgi:site-specific DNA-methyltransferase (adenine-specific)